ncbi:capsid protein [Actinidia chinensis var. chinensis]|uniref:Capsid protein n=1 Tax=Actinidia chinensis var. chinensis TaxID=1590841 RepID=A0A2R6PV83_ACTCC|nr:capsid protein [Actinidia chinensis var. chinensis]
MRGRFCCFVIILQLVSWVCVTSWPFAPNEGLGVPLQPGTTGQSSQSLLVTLSSITACLALGDDPGVGFLLISSPSEPTFPVFGIIFLSLISSPMAFELPPQVDMGRTGLPPSMATRSSAW